MPIDKHPPKNYSTNKRVKAPTPGAPAMGKPRTASGSMTLKVGDKSKTSAKFLRPNTSR